MQIKSQIFCISIALFVCSGIARASSTESCKGNKDALGVSRVIAVDPREHTRIGTMQYQETLPLADHEVDQSPNTPAASSIRSLPSA
jgi:hypothetical protein